MVQRLDPAAASSYRCRRDHTSRVLQGGGARDNGDPPLAARVDDDARSARIRPRALTLRRCAPIRLPRMREFLRALDLRRRDRPGEGEDALPGVLFVCTGNICRSPTAQAVFRVAATHAGIADRIRVDSAGTHGYHAGQPPDSRAVRAAHARGYDMTPLRARQIMREDFLRFDWIFAMDRANLRALTELRPPEYEGHLGLYLDLVPDVEARDVPDPYYGGTAGFERVLDLAEIASEALVDRLVRALPSDTSTGGPGGR